MPSAEQVSRAYRSCASFLADFRTWLSFANDLFDSLYFEHSVGWMRVGNIRPGCTAEIHGGSWSGHGDAASDADTISLFDCLTREYNLLTLTCLAPEHSLLVIRWLKRLGFVQAGVLPAWEQWEGNPRNVLILYREATHGR